MIIETAAYQLLKGDASILSIVQDGANIKIFGGAEFPADDDFPVLVYKPPPSGGREMPMVMGGDTPLISQPMQFISLSRHFKQAARLDHYVFLKLSDYAGSVSDPTTSPAESLTIQGVFLDQPNHGYSYLEELRVHQFLSQYVFRYIDPDK